MTIEFLTTRRWGRSAVILLLAVILTACGAGDDEEEPTATSSPEGAQPTVAVEEVDTPELPADDEGTPTNTDMSSVPASAVAVAEEASPITEPIDAPGDATPLVEPGVSATPVADAVAATPAGSDGTGVAPVEVAADPVVGDGTTGASVAAAEDAVPAASGATPAASPAAGTPAAAVAVTGCEVESVPAFTGEQPIFTLLTDVNFRVGPGTDCDLALEVPIGEFMQVEVVGGPVTRADDGSVWVQASFQGTIGWIAFDLLEPVS